ncbi:Copper/zinc superoxide dismutase (SODC) [Streptomyces sp. KY75]|nr:MULTISPECIES: superoxide dismutase family protein [Streptomyces]CAD5943858.1 Copper/zinc superoxide dismutase (SODC) [Streptomyces sp. KY75]CAD5986755.1 Copper/zinc superoxide dismutase (SODC) [Streptomyces sp. KY70]
MTAQVDRTAGAAGAAEAAGAGRASRAPGTVRRRVLVGAAALLMLTGGATIAHGAADGTDGAPAPDGGGHAAHSTGTGAGTGTGTGSGEAGPVGGASRSGGFWMRADGVFSPPGSFVPSDALTYDTALVPAAARIEITQYADRTSHRVGTRLRGLVPNRAYGMHVHTSPCAADPASAGPHYQHRASATADPVNEVWLDFRTDRNGNGEAEARHEWGFRDGGARSVIVHDAQGGAGKRVACFTVPFSS